MTIKNDFKKELSSEYNPVEKKLKLFEMAHLTLNSYCIKNGNLIHEIRVRVAGRSAFGVESLVYFHVNDSFMRKWIPDPVR